DRVTILAFVQGISQNVRFAEIRVSARDRIQVAVFDDGADGEPSGSPLFTGGNKFLYSPVLCSLVIEHRQNERKPSLYLRFIESIDSKAEPVTINAVPSSVQRGVFFFPPDPGLSIRVNDHQLEVAGEFECPVGSSFPDAQHWIQQCESW